MTRSSKARITQAIAVTAEVTGSDLSEAAMEIMVKDLASYDEADVKHALERCRREVTGRLSLAQIIQRIETGHPGPEEAWSICSAAIMSEAVTVVWTDAMSEAAKVAIPLAEDKIAARMAFLEAYRRELVKAVGHRPQWSISFGWDGAAREGPVVDAVRNRRLAASVAKAILPTSRQAIDEAAMSMQPALEDRR